MINNIYKLKSPRRFEIDFNDIEINDKVLVKPTHLSICNADQRYYQGLRDPKILREKLPIALIHEGIGQVLSDPGGTFNPGDTVILVPNIKTETNENIAENYLLSSKFSGSTTDGFLQDYILIEPERLVKLPDGIDKDVAAFTEIVSVSYHAISRFDSRSHSDKNIIGIWGDGNLAYITSLLLTYVYPDSKIYVFGIDTDKLNEFTFVDKTFLTTEIPDELLIDHAFECVGGNGSPIAIEQIIKYIKPCGTISILGVSEYPVPINTRMILEKGLTIFGSSRSGVEDFKKVVDLYTEHPEIPRKLSRLVGITTDINDFSDIKLAFDADINNVFGKTILHWNI